MKKSIQISKAEYQNLIGFPIIGFFVSLIFIFIAYYLTSVFGVIGFLIPAFYFFVMFIKRIISLEFHILSERISKDDLFFLIDLLVKMKGWEYGDIQNNEIIIHQPNAKKKDETQLTFQYFPDKIFINAIHKPIKFYDFSIRNHQPLEDFIHEAIIQKKENQDIAANWKREKALEKQRVKDPNNSSMNNKNSDSSGVIGIIGIIGIIGLLIFHFITTAVSSDFLKENLTIILCVIAAVFVNGFVVSYLRK